MLGGNLPKKKRDRVFNHVKNQLIRVPRPDQHRERRCRLNFEGGPDIGPGVAVPGRPTKRLSAGVDLRKLRGAIVGNSADL
jgi:hypothetical protein